MPFCSNCGNEIKQGVSFCGNCGKSLEGQTTNQKAEKVSKVPQAFDIKKILLWFKSYFLNFFVNYDSKLFKIAMSLLLAIGLGRTIYNIVYNYLPSAAFDWFEYAGTVYNFGLCVILFAVFLPLFLLKRPKQVAKKSKILQIFWITTLLLNLLVFIAGLQLSEYILYSNIAKNTVAVLMYVSVALLFYKNKPKFPFALIISLLSYVMSNVSVSSIKLSFSLYKSWNNFSSLINIFRVGRLGLLVLTIVGFLVVYLLPRAISKWVIWLPAIFVVIDTVVGIFDGYLITATYSLLIDSGLIIMVVLFALSCERNKQDGSEEKTDNETKEISKKSSVMVGVISLCIVVIITVAYLLTSAIVCATQINKGMEKWRDKIVNGELKSSYSWSQANEDILKYNSDKLVKSFVDDYLDYTEIKDNFWEMETISVCYRSYLLGKMDSEQTEAYLDLSVPEYWDNSSIFAAYYDMYESMKPTEDKVSATANINVDTGTITVTVENNNVMPISECTVNCSFTILFIEPGTYSSNEYGRGTETITVEDIEGRSSKTESISFDPDSYYDSYGSYIAKVLFDKSITIESID